MRRPGRLLLLTVLSVTVLLVEIHLPSNKRESTDKELGPEAPYDDFMLQRTYPNKTFDTEAYLSGLKAARHTTNSELFRSASVQQSWQLEGPGNIGGRFNCVTVNPLNHNVMYAGSANGGVWKTVDNALSWFPVFDSVATMAIGAITINPNDTSEIWVGTGDPNISGTIYLGSGLYKSQNGGQSWNYYGLGNTFIISSIIINPLNTDEMLVATMGNAFSKDNNRGIYRSADGGQSFQQVKYVNDSTGIIDMIQDPQHTEVIYASSFTRIRTERVSLYTGTQNFIFKSNDFGLTWNTLANGLPNGSITERIGLTLCQSDPDILYALYSSSDGNFPALYKSINAGATWNIVFLNQASGDYGTYGWYFGKIYCDPVNPDILYVPGVDLQYSTDGGNNFSSRTIFSPEYVHADGHHMVFLSPADIIYCTDGGIYRTTNGGADWNDIEFIPNNQFYAVTENPSSPGIYAGGVQDNGTMSGNASTLNNFTRIYGGDGFTVAYTSDTSLLYSEYQYGGIVYNDDYPSGPWIPIDKDGTQNYNWHTPYMFSPFSDDTLYFGGQSVMRIESAPYGSYTVISPTLNDPSSEQKVSNISTIDISKFTSSVLYAGTADGKVWCTQNSGGNWNDITPFQGINYYVTKILSSPNFPSNVYVTRSGYRANDNTPLVFKSNNYGGVWNDITGDLPRLAVNDIEVFPGDEDVIFVANDAGVYSTTNGGIHWERVGDNLPYVAVTDIQLNLAHNRIIAGTFGRSIYSISISGIISSLRDDVIKNIVKIFPTVSSGKIKIDSPFDIDSYEVYSSSGRLIVKGNVPDLDVSQLNAGNYFLRIWSGNKIYIGRFVKI